MSDQTVNAPSNDAGDATGATGHAAVPTGNQPDYRAMYEQALKDAEDYKKRFTGLQGTYSREQQKWQADAVRLKELDEAMRSLDTERTTLKALLADIQPKHESLQSQYDRLHIIATEFPSLLEFEKDGLLPGGTGDELRTKLSAFQNKLKTNEVAAVKSTMSGTAPATPKSEGQQTPKDLLNQAVAAMRQGKMDEYNSLYSQYLIETNKH